MLFDFIASPTLLVHRGGLLYLHATGWQMSKKVHTPCMTVARFVLVQLWRDSLLFFASPFHLFGPHVYIYIYIYRQQRVRDFSVQISHASAERASCFMLTRRIA